MIRLTFFMSLILAPFWLLGQGSARSEDNFEVEVYLDPYLSTSRTSFGENSTDELRFTYGAGANLNWKIAKNISLRGGFAFHHDAYLKKVSAPCAALSYNCLPVRNVKNNYLELPFLVQYCIKGYQSGINTCISGGFINQLLLKEVKTAFTRDRDIKRAGRERFHFKYWGGDFYLGLKLRKAIVDNQIGLFLEPNFRYSTAAFENGSVRYTDKTHPRFGLRTGIEF